MRSGDGSMAEGEDFGRSELEVAAVQGALYHHASAPKKRVSTTRPEFRLRSSSGRAYANNITKVNRTR